MVMRCQHSHIVWSGDCEYVIAVIFACMYVVFYLLPWVTVATTFASTVGLPPTIVFVDVAVVCHSYIVVAMCGHYWSGQ